MQENQKEKDRKSEAGNLQTEERLEKKRRIDWGEQGDGRRSVAGNRTRIAAGAQEEETGANEYLVEKAVQKRRVLKGLEGFEAMMRLEI